MQDFPALLEAIQFALHHSSFVQKSGVQSRRPSFEKVKNDSCLSVLKEFFVSRPVIPSVEDNALLPIDTVISWSRSDEDSDISTVPCLDELCDSFDHDPSEEDTFCVETVLRRTATTDSMTGEEEESVIVTFSADWRST